MKRSLSAIVHCLGAFILVVTLHAPLILAQQPKPDEQTFIKLQHDWAEARKNADTRFLETFYAKEFTVGLMSGENPRALRTWRSFRPAI